LIKIWGTYSIPIWNLDLLIYSETSLSRLQYSPFIIQLSNIQINSDQPKSFLTFLVLELGYSSQNDRCRVIIAMAFSIFYWLANLIFSKSPTNNLSDIRLLILTIELGNQLWVLCDSRFEWQGHSCAHQSSWSPQSSLEWPFLNDLKVLFPTI